MRNFLNGGMRIRTRIFRNEGRRRGRLLQPGGGVYHVMNRTAFGSRVLGPAEKEVFVRMLRKQAAFTGVSVLAFCVMDNHFHLLLEVRPVGELSDAELLDRYSAYYGPEKTPESTYSVRELAAILEAGGEEAETARRVVMARMGSLSAFMRELKQRFCLWYNDRHANRGSIWGGPFKSVLVERSPEAMTKVAAYIDLNPVRAGLARDPGEYRWCGYAECLAGVGAAREGLCGVYAGRARGFGEALRSYRLILFGKGYLPKKGAADNAGRVSGERLRAILESGGSVGLPELLRSRIRYFSEGVAIGSASFLHGLGRRGPGGEAGSACWGEAWEGLRTWRPLRSGVYQ